MLQLKALNCTLQTGIMLNGTTVDNIVVGGAAWLMGNQIKRGDILVEVLLNTSGYWPHLVTRSTLSLICK